VIFEPRGAVGDVAFVASREPPAVLIAVFELGVVLVAALAVSPSTTNQLAATKFPRTSSSENAQTSKSTPLLTLDVILTKYVAQSFEISRPELG